MPLVLPNWQPMTGETINTVAANTTVYLGPGGPSSSGGWLMPRKAIIREWSAVFSGAPGAGQSFGFRLFVNGSGVGPTITISDTGVFTTGVQAVASEIDALQTAVIQLVTSASAAAVRFRYYLLVQPR